MFKQKFIIYLILLFSLIYSFWHLDINPAGFFCDEALMGLEALSITKTGKDIGNERLPLFFKGFDFDNISPFQIYFTVPFIALFGLNETAVRLPAVFFSLIEILLFFLLLSEIIPKRFALLGTFLLTITPWHFHLSRINVGDYYSWTLLTTISLFLLFKAINTNKLKYFFSSSIFFGFATYSYTPSRLATPLLFLLFLITIALIMKKLKIGIIMLLIFIIVLIPFINFHLTDPHSFQRIKDTIGIDIKNKQNSKNITFSTSNFIYKYLIHYSYRYLFVYGDADFPGQFIRRHSISGIGLFYPFEFIFLILGLIYLISSIKKGRKEFLFILILLVIFPIPDSLTNDATPFATRSYLGIIPLQIIIIFGIYYFYSLLKNIHTVKKIIIGKAINYLLVIAVVISVYSLTIAFINNPLTTSDFWGWQFGPRDIISYFKQNEVNYDEFIMEPVFNAPQIFFPFYAYNDCQKCILGNLQSYNSSKKQLFALTPNYLNSVPSLQYETKKIIYYPSNEIAFKIIEVLQ